MPDSPSSVTHSRPPTVAPRKVRYSADAFHAALKAEEVVHMTGCVPAEYLAKFTPAALKADPDIAESMLRMSYPNWRQVEKKLNFKFPQRSHYASVA